MESVGIGKEERIEEKTGQNRESWQSFQQPNHLLWIED